MRLRVDPERPSPRKLGPAIEALRRDQVILYPTDTGYAFGCALSSRKGINAIRALKGHDERSKKPLSMLVNELSDFGHYSIMPTRVFRTVRRILPGAYTVVLEASGDVPRDMRNRHGEIGLRMPDRPLCRDVGRSSRRAGGHRLTHSGRRGTHARGSRGTRAGLSGARRSDRRWRADVAGAVDDSPGHRERTRGHSGGEGGKSPRLDRSGRSMGSSEFPRTRPPSMQQLSGLDAAFINMETRNAPTHISSLMVYDQATAPGGKVSFKGILANIESRLHLARCFRQKLVRVPFGFDHPYWIEDPDFDLEFHVRHIALPKPGDWRQLCIPDGASSRSSPRPREAALGDVRDRGPRRCRGLAAGLFCNHDEGPSFRDRRRLGDGNAGCHP